jgi:hypothetical protein
MRYHRIKSAVTVSTVSVCCEFYYWDIRNCSRVCGPYTWPASVADWGTYEYGAGGWDAYDWGVGGWVVYIWGVGGWDAYDWGMGGWVMYIWGVGGWDSCELGVDNRQSWGISAISEGFS